MSTATDDCKRPWDHGADYYDTSDQCEILSHESLYECLAAHLADRPRRSTGKAVADGVTVYAWTRDALDSAAEASRMTDETIRRMSEGFADEYGDPNDSEDGFSDEDKEECKAAILPAIVKLLESATVWRCSVTGKRTFTSEELLAWVREHNPKWLEGQS